MDIQTHLQRIKNNTSNLLELNNIVFFVALFISISLIWNTVSAIEKNFQLQTRVNTLSDEVTLLEIENENLDLNNTYFQTDDYLELAARESLGLVRPGEKVLVLPDYTQLVEESVQKQALSSAGAVEASNFDQWLYFLFRRSP